MTSATRSEVFWELQWWTRNQIHQNISRLRKLRGSDPEIFTALRAEWSAHGVITDDELNRLLGDDDNSNPAPTDIFEQYVYVEKTKRFCDLRTGDRKAGFRSLSDTWADTTTPHGRLMLTVLGGLAEFERELIRARTGEGRARAVARRKARTKTETDAASAKRSAQAPRPRRDDARHRPHLQCQSQHHFEAARSLNTQQLNALTPRRILSLDAVTICFAARFSER